MKQISVIGSGTMGNGIAQTFALYDFNVTLFDISTESLENAKKNINRNLQRMVNRETISEEDLENTCRNILYSDNFNSVINSDLVIEAVTENIEIKKSIFKDIDSKCPKNTIIASNTSSISITKLAEITKRKDKVIGMHFMNPVPIMKLVEVINSKYTSKETTETILNLSKKLNKIPLTVNDYPGFISNRILMPMINEAIESLEQGVANVKNIDGIMKLGMGHPMGPLQLADLIGLDVCKSILEVMFDGLNKEKYKPNNLLVELVNDGKLGVKSGEGFYDYSDSKKAEYVSKKVFIMIAQNINNIISDIPENVKLIAISKTKPNEDIMTAYKNGHRFFGENKIQEMSRKFSELPKDINWHMVGHVQSNKIKYMAPFVELIHGIDSFKSVRIINKEGNKNSRVINCLLQLKISDEDSKFGLEKEDLKEIIFSEEYLKMKNVKIKGIMAMATNTPDTNVIKSEFMFAKKTFDEINSSGYNLEILSMGMSNDYQLAINCGSNMIRVGSLIFGERN